MVIGLLVGSSAVIVIVEWDEMWEMGWGLVLHLWCRR